MNFKLPPKISTTFIGIVVVFFANLTMVSAQETALLNLMPMPNSVKINSGKFVFTDKFLIAVNGPPDASMIQAVNRFYLKLGRKTGLFFPQEFINKGDHNPDAQLQLTFTKSIQPAIGMDESYSIRVTPDKIKVSANTNIGIQRALETLYQFVAWEEKVFYCQSADIEDQPRFKWRGLMIDVSRHFMPIEVIKRNIDAMSTVKMNVLHLHLSDDEGFRVESKIYPLLQEKGSNGEYYSQDQLRDLVKYAHDRGIIVVPEFDLPGHCTSILAAYPQLGSYPAAYRPSKRFRLDTIRNINVMKIKGILDSLATPTIDPTKEGTYTFFDAFIKEMTGIFTDPYFHVGADENNGVAWKHNPQIQIFMKAHGIKTTDDLQAYFVQRMHRIAQTYHRRLIGWEEAFNTNLSPDVIVQKWKLAAVDSLSNKVITHGNQLIISSGYYLDVFMPAYIHYASDPVSTNVTNENALKGILGGEAAIWTEMADRGNEETRVWPRAAAIAERLWSDKRVKDADDMYRRLWVTDRELNANGLDEQANYERIIRSWTTSNNYLPVKALVDVCAPVKGYRRMMFYMLGRQGIKLNLSNPLVGIADVAQCDQEARWRFRQLVAKYLSDKSDKNLRPVKLQLQEWQSNKPTFNTLSSGSPYLEQLTVLSNRLSDAATLTLNNIGNSDNKEVLTKLKSFEAATLDVQITVFPEMEALVSGTLKDEPIAFSAF